MKITIDNLTEQYPKISVKLPKELNQGEFEFVKDNLDLYKEDDTIKKYIDTFIIKLNEIVSKEQTITTHSKSKETKQSAAKSKTEYKKKSTTAGISFFIASHSIHNHRRYGSRNASINQLSLVV